jgi:beta-glucosidase
VTFYESVDQLPPFTDYSMKGRTYRYFKGKPLYPFGYGLSYSQFRYSETTNEPAHDGKQRFSAKVTNTSKRSGDEVAQLYLSDKDHNLQLMGFQRFHLGAGESKTLSFDVDQKEINNRVAHIGGGQTE